MKKRLDSRELSEKAEQIAGCSDFKLYEENGKYIFDCNLIHPIIFDTIEELNEYIEAFEENQEETESEWIN